MFALADMLLARLDGRDADQRAQAKADETLDACLRALLASARQRWPGLLVSDDAFVAHLARCISAASTASDAAGDDRAGALSLADAVSALQTDDLFLALACARAADGALAAFEKVYASHISAVIGRVLSDPDMRDDAEQLVRDRLFVAEPGQRPRILEYRGRGTLLAFLRVVSSRVALGIVRKRQNREQLAGERDDHAGWELPDHGDDPELQYLKVLYRKEFKSAFVTAVQELSPRARTLLRYHLIDRLSIDKIAAIYDVHRATAARQLSRAKDDVIRATKRCLQSRLRLGADELSSILRLVEGNVDVSVRRLLVEERD